MEGQIEYKRARKQLKAVGIKDIRIVKRLWGAVPEHISATKQSAECFKTWQQALDVVMKGYRPTIIEM